MQKGVSREHSPIVRASQSKAMMAYAPELNNWCSSSLGEESGKATVRAFGIE